ncbi:multidrug resistance-associated protein 1-like [Babylonia areolata]|uniref:multidrug resistance-associated protein 1-like n=1 Tax=Babylonia areolata TaxID=304850 RepID=UPI003FD41757
MSGEDEGDFYRFCGNSSIFNTSLLLDNSWPQFTECFQNSLLVWVPCGWLWITLPFYLPYLCAQPPGLSLPVNLLNTLRTFGCVLLAILAGIDVLNIAESSEDNGNTVADVIYVSGGIRIVTFVLAAMLIQLERRKGIITSGILWLFFLFLTVAGIVPFYSKIKMKEYDGDLFQFSLFYLYYALVLVQLVLHSFAEKLVRAGYDLIGEKPSPEVSASFPNRLVFWWINSLVLRAYRHGLKEEDLPELHPRDKSSTIVPVLQRAWDAEVRRTNRINREREKEEEQKNRYVSYAKHSQPARPREPTERTPLRADGGATISEGAEDKAGAKKKKKEPSLLKVLVKTYGLDLLQSHFCKLIYDLLQFVNPQLLNVLIAYVNNKENEAEWKGYVYACAFMLVSVTGSVFFHQQFHIGMTLGMRIKSACISAVYRKSLTMTNEARKGSTVGEIVNLMSVDCQRLQDVTGYLWMVWSAPVQITLALVLLWGQLGAAVLAGVGIMVLLIPLNAVIAFKSRQYQMQQMKLKDARLKLMNEVLSGMKVLKLYAWELSFQGKVTEIRNKELHVLKKSAYLNAFSTFVWTLAPFLVTLATFATYVLSSSSHYLDAQKAFVSLSLFNILRFPINLLPMIISFLAQAQVSLSRIGKFLSNEDLDESNVHFDRNAGSAVSISSGTFTWDQELPIPTIRNINVDIPRGQLVAVVGQVGAGKSSLVSAVLGEMRKLQGNVVLQSSVAYVPQQAWIQNATLKDNILFGKQEKFRNYQKVIDACALRPDLDILPGGDQTEIGEKGINLSGGQKQRVSLARAVYSDADIYLLDDPLSAVDSHVGKHIFNEVIGSKGLLRNKTRVLVTHGVHWLPMVDQILVMSDGTITEAGSYEELLSHDGDFAQFLKAYLTQDEEDEEEEDLEIQAVKAKMLERVDSVTTDASMTSGDEATTVKRKRSLSPQASKPGLDRSTSTTDKDKEAAKPHAGDKDKLIEQEKAETGRVRWSVFMTYFRAIGLSVTVLIFSLYAVYQGLSVYSSIWLSQWTDDDLLANTSLSNTSRYQNRNYMYLGVYGGLGVGQAVCILAYSILATTRMVMAAGNLHHAMLTNIMRSPMSFFDTTPSGRVVNRFSSDVAMVDNVLPGTFRMAVIQIMGVLSTLIVISYSTPIFLAVIVPLGLLYYLVQRFYVPTSRQLKRIESTTRSPIFNHFSETISGASSVRAYRVQDRFTHENEAKVDKNLTFYFNTIASNRWLGFRLEFLGNLVVLAAAMFAVVTPELEGGLVGLSVSYAMQVTQGLNWMVRMASDLETNIVSVERLKEYSETPTEAAWEVPGERPPSSWPDTGTVDFLNYAMRYRPGLDLVIKGVSCHIDGGEKVGIVGRTGAGKSSMTVALFRLIESASGSIVIDRHNISTMGLHDLRSRITILPQDPVLFSGSLRMNLDPFDQYTDERIWTALEHAHLKKFVQDTPAQLMYECGEGGANLSVGQRQLVCLARSLLRKTKILVLDEATAAVDMETDDLIQQTIRSEFKDCTVLTIAHRLNTIMDYNKIMVLDQGEIREYDSPDSLLQRKDSVFYSMAKDANLV